jgi:hypothetical protein
MVARPRSSGGNMLEDPTQASVTLWVLKSDMIDGGVGVVEFPCGREKG